MDFNLGSTTHADLVELEEILKFQRSGRRLSTTQMESLNDYVSRRLSMNSSLGGTGDFLDFPASRRYSLEFSHMNDPNFWQGDGFPNFNSNQYDGSFDPLWNQRRRSSALAMQNFMRYFNLDNPLSNMGDQVASDAPSDRRMEKRTSLDLLGDAAAALSHQDDKGKDKNIGTQEVKKGNDDSLMKHITQSGNVVQKSQSQRNSNQGRSPMNRRSTLDMLMHGDGTLGDRRSSLSFILGQDFYPSLSRNNSLGLGSLPPQHMNDIFDDTQPLMYMPMSDMRMQASSLPENNRVRQMMEQEQNVDNLDYMAFQNMQELYRRYSQTGAFNNYQLNGMMQNMNQQHHQNKYLDSLRHSQGMRRLSSFETPGTASPKQTDKKQTPSKNEPESLPFIQPERVKAFTEMMEKSQDSQVSIQAWDKKMGLKRSHSATMTKTTRSRKALRELFEVLHTKLENDAQNKTN